MKRGGPMVRRTPLARAGMPRARFGRTTGRRALARVERDAAWDRIRLAVYSRDAGRCILCGEYVPADRFECHHRKLKSRGGLDVHSNLVTLCGRCHHDRVHAFPEWSKDVGLMVPSWVEPVDWPVLRFTPRVIGGLWAVPDDLTGQWIVTAPDADQHDEPAPWGDAA